MNEGTNLPTQESKIVITMQRPGSPEAIRHMTDVIAAAVSSVLVPLFNHLPTVSFSVQAEVPKVNVATSPGVDPLDVSEATYPPHHEGRNA